MTTLRYGIKLFKIYSTKFNIIYNFSILDDSLKKKCKVAVTSHFQNVMFFMSKQQ